MPSVTRLTVWWYLVSSRESRVASHEGRLADQVPDLFQKPARAADALVAEVAALLERAQEHQVHPEGVGAPLGDVVVGHDDVALGLGHLGAVLHDQAMRPE